MNDGIHTDVNDGMNRVMNDGFNRVINGGIDEAINDRIKCLVIYYTYTYNSLVLIRLIILY